MAEPTCADKLAEARVALHKILTQKAVLSVGYGERRIQYSQANIGDLRAYIAALEEECGSTTVTKRQPLGVVW